MAMDQMTRERILRIVALVLVVAAGFSIIGQVIYVLSIPGVHFADRLDLISQIAGPTLGVLVLGAALLPLVDAGVETDEVETDEVATDEVADTTNWVSMAAAVLGGVIFAAALYSIIHTISLHIPSPGETGQSLQLSVSSRDWAGRIGAIFLRLAGGVIGACAAWIGLKTSGVRRPSTPLTEP
jgi:hypothetical protein